MARSGKALKCRLDKSSVSPWARWLNGNRDIDPLLILLMYLSKKVTKVPS